MRGHVDGSSKGGRSSLRGVRAGTDGWITQDTLENLLLRRHARDARISILS